jgi:MFS family permease
LGVAVAAVLIGLLGLAPGISVIFEMYLNGMIGSGMFHPIAASTIGALVPSRRSQAVSLFFIAGMVGGVAGAAIAPRILLLDEGFAWLAAMALPGLLIALILHFQIRSVPHRARPNPLGAAVAPPNDWRAVGMLYVAAAMRFTVNLALVYLYTRLIEQWVIAENPGFDSAATTRVAAPVVGNLVAFTMAGMAAGGLLAGSMIPAGREKWPLVACPVVFAPAIALLPSATSDVMPWLAFLSGIGFAAMVPVTLAVAQRLLPTRTSLASGLMLGGAWSVAMVGPILAEWIVLTAGMSAAFFATAGLLALSGILLLPFRSASLAVSATIPLGRDPVG